MSIWGTQWEIPAYETDYQPRTRTAEVYGSVNGSWNDCLRLSVWSKDDDMSTDCMLTRPDARVLAAKLLEWADSQPPTDWFDPEWRREHHPEYYSPTPPDDDECRDCYEWRPFPPGQEDLGYGWFQKEGAPWTCEKRVRQMQKIIEAASEPS